MPFLRTLALTALTALVALSLGAGMAQAKPKGGKWKKDHHHHHEYDDHHGRHVDCGNLPPGLAKQGKVPPGWQKKCGGHVHEYREHHSHDRHNQDYGYHHDRTEIYVHPCRSGGDKASIIVGTTAAGATMGGLIGSATGDAASGAVLGGVVGGILGADAAKNQGRRPGDC